MFCLKTMNKSHVREVSEIEKYSFSEPWSEKAFLESLDDNNYHMYCLVDECEKVLGYLCMTAICGEGEITNVAIAKEQRGRGLGKQLLSGVIMEEKRQGTEKLFLEVRESNIPAISVYKNVGFVENGIRKNFYRMPTENALLMELSLEEKEC